MKENILVAFSGGRTSAYMCYFLKENMNHLYNLKFVYANTGLEHEKTLEFVDKVDRYFNLDLVWIESVINPLKNKGSDFVITNYKDACRDNRLFKDMCSKYGLPNQTYIHCTRELKNIPMLKYGNNIFGTGNFKQALGIRADEYKRVSLRPDLVYPLANIISRSKKDILEFWENQSFDLEIEEHYGNCVTCYKKSDKKLKMIADENPHYFDSFIELENLYANKINTKEEYKRSMFRHFRTAHEVKNNLKLPVSLNTIDECAEECGSVIK